MKRFLLLALALAGVSTAHADVYCRFDPAASPSSFLRVDTRHATAYTLTGWPVVRTPFREVIVEKTANGFKVKIAGDVVLVQAAYTGSATLWFDQNEATYPFEAYWNPKIPGGPTREQKRGVCWTDKLQKTSRNPEHPVN
ncbi:MAG: hypothetical protein ACXVA9_09380 [Bdellovibrionales bacterium]